jgi:hypothetical protein
MHFAYAMLRDRLIFAVIVASASCSHLSRSSTRAANAIGIGRGADLLLYVFLLFSLFHNVHLAARLRTIDAQVTRLVRDTAIAAVIRPDTSTMPRDARHSQV